MLKRYKRTNLFLNASPTYYINVCIATGGYDAAEKFIDVRGLDFHFVQHPESIIFSPYILETSSISPP